MVRNTQARDYQTDDKSVCLAIFDSNTPPYFDPSERSLFEKFLDATDGTYLVIEHDGDIVGCGGFAAEDDGQTISFTWGMVERSYHKDGFGRFLTEARMAHIRQLDNVSAIRLNTTPDIAPFFQHMGFTELSVEPDGYAPGMDKVEMVFKDYASVATDP